MYSVNVRAIGVHYVQCAACARLAHHIRLDARGDKADFAVRQIEADFAVRQIERMDVLKGAVCYPPQATAIDSDFVDMEAILQLARIALRRAF